MSTMTASPEIPQVSYAGKGRELLRFGVTRVRVSLNDFASPGCSRPVSDKGRYTRNYVEPLFNWWGANQRVLMSQSLGRVSVDVDVTGTTASSVVNGASHNYAGFYQSSAPAEELQRQALEALPVSQSEAVPLLRDAMHNALATFWRADFCVTCSTGYGSNVLALPALLAKPDAVVVMDRDCHNSMFTGAFLGGREVHKFRHSDMRHLESILDGMEQPCKNVIVCIEGLYSMGGDVPPLDELHRLKQRYGFMLYCDEAHSFLSLGSTGRGCLEFWNEKHSEAPLPWDLIDVRTGTLSKAIGGIGGFVAGKAHLEAPIRAHISQQTEQESISVPTSTMVQTLWVLQQPLRTAHNLRRLAQIASFCRTELRRRGVFLYGISGTPVLPIWAGRPSVAAKLSYALRGAGLLASPVATPAVPFWESRVRVNLSADLTDEQVNQLLDAITSTTARIGIRRRTKLTDPQAFESTCGRGDEAGTGTADADTAFQNIQSLIQNQASSKLAPSPKTTHIHTHSPAIIAAGHASRIKYGIGSGSARWISGTFTAHLATEAQVVRITGAKAALTYPDPSLGLTSTVAALARPLSGFKRHCMLYPTATEQHQYVRDGLKLAPPSSKKAGSLRTYGDVRHLVSIVREQAQEHGTTGDICFTVYLDVAALAHSQISSILADLAAALALGQGQNNSRCAMTVLLQSPSRLLDMRALQAQTFPSLHLLLYGSFTRTLGLPGGYLAGPEGLVRELRYTSRGYMFTTSPPPFVMDMIGTALGSEMA